MTMSPPALMVHKGRRVRHGDNLVTVQKLVIRHTNTRVLGQVSPSAPPSRARDAHQALVRPSANLNPNPSSAESLPPYKNRLRQGPLWKSAPYKRHVHTTPRLAPPSSLLSCTVPVVFLTLVFQISMHKVVPFTASVVATHSRTYIAL